MGIKTFAAIDVGSYEVSMKIFELSKKNGVHEIDYIRHRIDLGTETYNTGHISYERMDELCELLNGYTQIMETYRVDDYKAYGTSAIRETVNTKVVTDQIKLRTGLNVSVLSNSEQRFLDYKSIALKSKYFSNIIDCGTAIIDIGGGSTQVSLFADSKLVCTVNLPLGILKLRSKLNVLQPGHLEYEEILSELIDNEIHNFRKIYLSQINIRNIIVVDDYLSQIALNVAKAKDTVYVTGTEFLELVETLRKMPQEEAAKKFGIQRENAALLMPSAVLVRNFIRVTAAEKLWIPGVSLADGIAYDYAERNKIIVSNHDFTRDIISCANNISARYKGSQSVGEELVAGALAIFDAMKKLHGLNKRERLLLELAARLHDVGCYVSLSAPAESSYSIIMGTEISGISHLERLIIATVVYNAYPKEVNYDDFNETEFNEKVFLTVTKLTAILRVASGMARSPRKKYRSVKAQLREKELVLTVESDSSLTLEKGFFLEQSLLFEEVFGIRPVLREKKGVRF